MAGIDAADGIDLDGRKAAEELFVSEPCGIGLQHWLAAELAELGRHRCPSEVDKRRTIARQLSPAASVERRQDDAAVVERVGDVRWNACPARHHCIDRPN